LLIIIYENYENSHNLFDVIQRNFYGSCKEVSGGGARVQNPRIQTDGRPDIALLLSHNADLNIRFRRIAVSLKTAQKKTESPEDELEGVYNSVPD
jgi:hypothetical protein